MSTRCGGLSELLHPSVNHQRTNIARPAAMRVPEEDQLGE